MVWSAVLGTRTMFFFLRAHQLASDGARGCVDSRSVILGAIVEVFGYVECKEDKWDCKERGSGRCSQKGKFELFSLTETKLKGNREIS